MGQNEPFQPADRSLTDPLMTNIRAGMKVYDRDGNDVGKVEDVYLGEVNQQADDRGEGPATARTPAGNPPGMDRTPAVVATHVSNNSFPAAVTGFTSDDNMPDVLRKRLIRMGFVRVEKGLLFGKSRYILPDQIASVEGDRVDLKANKDELIKG